MPSFFRYRYAISKPIFLGSNNWNGADSWGAVWRSTVAKRASFKPFVAVWLLSYSAYLWHQAIFAIFRMNFLGHKSVALTIPLVFILSFISYRYVKVPFRDRKRYSRKAVFSFSLLLFSFLGAFGLNLKTSIGPPYRITNEYNDIFCDREKNNKVSCHSRPNLFIAPKDACEMGSKDGNKTSALLDNSHADAVAFEIDRAAAVKRQAC